VPQSRTEELLLIEERPPVWEWLLTSRSRPLDRDMSERSKRPSRRSWRSSPARAS